MKFSVVAAALASSTAVYGHSTFQYMWLNGVDLGSGPGSYIRGPPSNSPVKNPASADIICNVNNSPVPKTIEVSGGDVLTMEWQHSSRGDDIIDPTHKGPVMVYIAPTSSNGKGAVWQKLFNQGFTDDWATNKLIANKGKVSITIPNLTAGEYLIRPEIIALHEADTDFAVNSGRGAQYYMACAQIKVVSSGPVALLGGIDFQTDYKTTDPGILFNLYGGPDPKTYVPPGGDVASFAVTSQAGLGAPPAAGSKPTSAAPSSSAAPTNTAAAPSTSAAPTSAIPTSAASTSVVGSTLAPVPTTTKAVTTRAPLPTTRMITSTVKPTTTAGPTQSACPTVGTGSGSGAAIKKYYQCGGVGYIGSTACEEGSTCKVQNPYYSQCI